MIILGVADGPDASAALVANGTLVASVAQERVDRERHSRAFPSGAIDAVLDVAGLRAREVDRVVFGTGLSPSTLLRARPGLRARVTPRLREAWRGYQSALRASGLYVVEQDISRKLLAPKLAELGFENASIEMVEHDRAHATAAYRCQDHAEAVVITVDTPGDGAAVTVSVGRHLQLDRVFLQTALATICTFPVRVARILNVEPAQLWALAAGATAPTALTDVFRSEVGVAGEGFTTRALVREPDPLARRIRAFSPAEAAAAAQEAIEAAVLAFVRHWMGRTHSGNLVVAGAVFSDPRLCGRLLDEPGVESLSVFPVPGDEGLAIGAALGLAGTVMRRLPTLGLGPRYTEPHCYKALSVANLPRKKVDDPETLAAELIAQGKTVARFADGLEIGDGSLANRTVLFRADDAALRARALAALRRPEWAPVGAAVPLADISGLPALDRAPQTARYRTLAVMAPGAFATVNPSVVHADGRVLPFVVDPADAPDMARLCEEVRVRTGSGVLAQLDLRYEGEPMACSPGDAIRTWRASEVDALLLGPYLVERSAVAT